MERMKLTVILDNDEEHDLVITNPAMIAWDRTRVVQNWPTSTEAPFLWMTFVCWKQLTYQGLIDCKWKEFEETRCIAVGDTDEEEAVEDPTRPIPEPDSA